MICHIIEGGKQNDVILGSSRTRYVNAKLSKALCNYHVSAKSDLVITLSGAATCPFKGATAQTCSITVAKHRRGSFEFKVQSGQ